MVPGTLLARILGSISFTRNTGLTHTQMVLTVNVLKFRTLHFLLSIKMLIFRAAISKMLVRIANRGDPDQTASNQSDLGLRCLGLFGRELAFKILETLL